ncbi:MAG TPA: HpsJ family protein [Coleofasciculaceae cyanobacterium]
MNPKNALASSSVSPLASRTLKTVGVIVVLAALLDTLILSMPYQLLERQWQINFTTQLVDRGVVPLVGLVLLLVGFWIDSSTRDVPPSKTVWQNPRFYVFVFSSLLGLLFLLLFPLHLVNVAQERTAAITQVDKQATDAETQLNTRLQSEITSQRSQITQLLGATDEQLTQLVQNGQLTQEQAGLIRKFKADPKGVDPFLKQREDELRTQSQTSIRTQKQQAEQNLSTESLKSGLRIGISSLLLAIGYTVMGWSGLRNLQKS